MKRFACQDVIPGCDRVFTGADDQSVLDQVIAHAADDHGLVKPPLALVELVVATTHSFVPARARGHLRLVGESDRTVPSTDGRPGDRIHGDSLPSRAAGERTAVVTQATDRFRRPSAHPAGDAVGPDTAGARDDDVGAYRHECVLYRGLDDFLAIVVPFLRAGVELDQPVMVAIAEPRLAAVREAMGEAGEQVQFVDMAELGHNPARIIPAWRDFATRHGGRPLRGIGEPIWVGRRDSEVVESQLHEALLNLAVSPDTPLWLLCPYDIDALDPAVISEARRSHPFVGPVDRPGVDHTDIDGPPLDYGGADHLQSLFTAALPQPAGRPATLRAGDPTALADGVLRHAAKAGLATDQSAKLATAIGEIVWAGTRESVGPVQVRIWRDELALVCEVGDDGPVLDPMIGRGTGFPAAPRDRGIRLANELCDLVQVRSGPDGTTVRVHSWL